MIANKISKGKLVFMIPETVFTSEGNYGLGFKQILQINDKFLGGINKFKDNTIFIITFAKRKDK